MNTKVLLTALLIALLASAFAATNVDHNVLSLLSSVNEANTLLKRNAEEAATTLFVAPEYHEATEQDYSAHNVLSTLASALNHNNEESAQVLNRADDTNALLAQLAASLASTQTSKAQGESDSAMLTSLSAILAQGGVQSISTQTKHNLEASLTNLETELQNKEAALQRQLAENTLSAPEFNDHEVLTLLASAAKEEEVVPEEQHQTLTAQTLLNDQALAREVEDWKKVLSKRESESNEYNSPETHEVLSILAEAEKEETGAGSAEVLGAGYATSEESDSTVAPTTQEESGQSVLSYFTTGLAYLLGRKN